VPKTRKKAPQTDLTQKPASQTAQDHHLTLQNTAPQTAQDQGLTTPQTAQDMNTKSVLTTLTSMQIDHLGQVPENSSEE
jgi:hypothetical protein